MALGVNFYLVDARKYTNELLPAYRDFTERAERAPLKSILREAISVADNPQHSRPGFVDFPAVVYEEYGSILDGTQYYSRIGDAPTHQGQTTSKEDLQFFVKNILAPALLTLVCVESARGLNPWQNMHRPEFTDFLYSGSRWIEDRLTFAVEFSGEQPEIVIGEWSRFLADDDVKMLDQELTKMPSPTTAEVASDYENLRAQCGAASDGKNARILACIL